MYFLLLNTLNAQDRRMWMVHSWYLCWSSQGPSVWPWWARSAGSRTLTDSLGHRTVSSLISTSPTLSGCPGPYNSHTSPPSGQKWDGFRMLNKTLSGMFLSVRTTPWRTSHWTSWHRSHCRSPEWCLRTAGWCFSYRAGCSGYSLHTSNPTSW